MPIVEYRLVQGRHDDASIAALLTRSCALFAEVLESPTDRIRAFVHELPATRACIGGVMASDGAEDAPFFTFALLEGRPVEHRLRLLAGFTDLLVECLGVDRSRVRGGTWIVPPDAWAIAGTPASVIRQAEVDARAAAAREG